MKRRTNMKQCILIIACIFNIITAHALTVNEVLESVKQNNFALKASEQTKNSAISSIKSTNNLSNPEVGFEYHEGANVYGNKYGISVTQKFEWPGLYKNRSDVNKALINVENTKQLSEYLNVLLDAKQLCIQIINLNRKLKVQETVVANITKLYSEYEKGFNHGEISILDINKLKIELLNTKRAYDELVSQRAGLFEKLTSLNGNKEIENLSSLYDYPTQSLESLDYYLAEVIKYDPSYLTLVANLDASNKNLSSAKMGWLPDLALSYKYSNEMGSKFNGFAVGVSVPIFANRNKVSASKSELIAAELTQKDVLAELESAIKTDYSHIVTAKSQIHSYNNVLESGNNEKMLQKALEGGQISLLDYLLELRYFLEAQQTLLDLEFEYNTLMTDLNKYQLLN